ncbi:MAG: hypothetical protein ACXVDJ_00340 [Tumebacillaceae bacterium]
MNQEQKKIIVQEINHWRNSKLLPAEYCDFLLNLYMEGESFSAEQKDASGKGHRERSGGHSSSRTTGQMGRILLILGALLLFLIFAFNFTSFPQPMQIFTPLLVTLISYLLAWRKGRNNPLVRVSWLLVGSVMAMLSGYFYLATNEYLSDKSAILGVMSVVCIVWLLSAALGRSRIVASMGWGGLMLVFANLLEAGFAVGEKAYGVQHFYWMIPALLSLFISYLLGRGRVYISPVFLLFGLLACFGPELRMLAFSVPMDFFVQAICFLKLAVLVSLLVVFHSDMKNWMHELSV